MKLKKVGVWLVLLMLLCAFGLGSIATVWAAAPAAPKNLTGIRNQVDSNATRASVILNWNWDNPNDSNRASIRIERLDPGSSEYSFVTTLSYNVTTYTDNDCEFGKSYSYKVIAVDVTGNYSIDNPVYKLDTFPKPPNDPPSLALLLDPPTQIILIWDPYSSEFPITGFKIEKKIDSISSSYSQISTPDQYSNTFTDSNLVSGINYTYRIRAYNEGGNSPYSIEETKMIGNIGIDIPTAPSGLSATLTNSVVTLNWSDASNNETGFIIDRKAGNTWTAGYGTANANVTTWSDSALVSGTIYTYRVCAKNDAGYSAYSNEATPASVSASPAAPSDLVLEVTSKEQIKLTWTDNSNNETGFEVWRRKDGGNDTLITTSKSNTAATATYTDSGLTQGSTYYYQIRAIIAASGSTAAAYSGYCYASTTIAAPSAPSGLNVYQATSTRNELTWRDNSDNETGFKIERSKDGAAYALLTTTKANVTLYTDNTVVAGSVYDYRIKATNGVGDSYENYASSGNQSGYMYAPTNVILDVRSTTSIKLDWQDNSSNETGFKIERRADNGSFTQISTVGRNVTTYTDNGLSQGRSYSYRVRAYNDRDDSSYSAVATATTTAPTAPSTLRANWDTNARIRLVWQDRSDNETGFKIERSKDGGAFSQLTTVGPNETSYTDRDIASGTDYVYRVMSYNGIADSDPTNTATPTGGAPADEKRIVLTVGSSGYYVNDQRSVMDAPPIITENRTSLPIRYIAEAIGAEVAWDGTARKTTITMPGIVIELEIGKSHGYVNGIPTVIDADNPNVQPFIQPPGRIMLPLRFVTENMGCKVDYNSFTKEISIQYPAS